MTLPAVAGDILLPCLLLFLVATEALPVKDLPQAPPAPGAVAFLAPDPGLPGFQIAFLQNILPLLITVMALLAGEVPFHMTAVRKGNRRPLAGLKRRTPQLQSVRLGSKE
jgi:hypothetical protein